MTTERFQRYARIGRPREAHEAATIEAYERVQVGVIAHNKKTRPSVQWRDPFEADATGLQALISGGCWGVLCPSCNNMAVYDPDWRLAFCLECGARYRDIEPPEGWEQIEAVLMARDDIAQRSWRVLHALGHAAQPETIDELRAQNVAHGERDPFAEEGAGA